MPKIKYQDINFSEDKLNRIRVANQIIEQYARQGFDLTLRQLYYQFVARGHVANNVKEYDRLGDLIGDARLAGLIDWDCIVDRTRNLMATRHWDKPSQLIEESAHTYRINKWDNQTHYVEVWVEKDALKDVIAKACSPLDVPFFSCRGYTSLSEAWAAGQRLIAKAKAGKTVHIIHLGDHDPSGIDMSRDIKSRLSMFVGESVHVLRIALNMPQIQRYSPPPNPAKTTDSRFADYQAKYGDESWELDSLEPTVLVSLINRAVYQYLDSKLWEESVEREKKGRGTLRAICKHFPKVVEYLRTVKTETHSTKESRNEKDGWSNSPVPPAPLQR